MNKGILKEVILEQKEMQRSLDRGIKREKLESLTKYFSMPHSIVVSGIRRVGKSTLLAQIIHSFHNDKAYYFSFEDERLIKFCLDDFNVLFEMFIELFGERSIVLGITDSLFPICFLKPHF